MAEEIIAPSEPATAPQPEAENRLLKYALFALAGLLLLSAGAAGGYWYGVKSSNLTAQMPKLPIPTQNLTPIETPAITPTSTTDPTADWKTYTNTKYGFSFKYPGEWNINVPSFEGKHESNKTLSRVDVTNSLDFKNAVLLGNKKDVLNMSISVWDNEDVKPFESVLAEWDNFRQNPKPNSTSIKEISQIKWTRRELINASSLPIVEFITLKGKYLYVVVISPQDSTLIDFADQILSTFKFLD